LNSPPLTAADHADDLDGVAVLKRDAFIGGSLEDRSVVLHRDRARIDAKLFDVSQQGRRLLEVDLLAVYLHRDHSNSPIAA